MGAITGMLGLGGGAAGTSFGGPSMASQQGNNNMQAAFDQLQQVAGGQGPNPAMAKYNENIQNLAKQQAGAISSVQGISPALTARLASQQGSAAMQNAAAQGATMQAQQQLGALGQMGNIGAEQQMGANQMMGNMNTTNAGLAMQTMQNQMGFMGGMFGGAGAAMMPAAAAEGGQAGADFGNPTQYYDAPDTSVPFSSPPQQQEKTRSLLSQFLAGDASNSGLGGPAAMQKGMTEFGAGLGARLRSGGGATPENAGQGPTVANAAALPAQQYGLGFGAAPVAPAFAKGGSTDFRSGGMATPKGPSQRAVKNGNSYANDKIPALLSEGEVVIPRNVMQSQNPVKASADFVANVIAKRRAGR